jgi:hypothetical protein
MASRPRIRLTLGSALFSAGLFLLALLVPTPTQGQSLAEKVREFASTASGYTLRAGMEEGALQESRQVTFPAELDEGVDYLVVGFCDTSCTNLDLSVLDPSGAEIGNDYLPDAQPVVLVRPGEGGVHQVLAEMVSCNAEPCRFVVGILEGEPGEGDPSGGDMLDRLNRFRWEILEDGFTEVGSPEAGNLGEDQEIRFPVSLTAGVDYRIAGVCDNDCDDLDLVLYDPSGLEVASDFFTDAVPLLSFTLANTVEGHRIAVIMVRCRIEPCGFLVSTFARGEGLGPGGVPIAGTPVLHETHQGSVEDGDEILEDGKSADRYTVRAEAGQTIIADLRSPDFDTYLTVEGPAGIREENDDWGDDTMHSHIEIVAPAAGVYSVVVTTFLAEERGEYTLQIALVEGS